MAKCSGCASGGLTAVLHDDTNCIHLTGDGTSGSHLVATLQIDPASPATITCGVDGLSVAGGGGGTCQQKNLYTVGTVGPSGFGSYLGTSEPFLSCADFVGDGVNDEVAIQAAIDAAIGTLVASVWPEVYLGGGIFATDAAIDCKGVTIRGAGTGTFISNGATSSGFPLLKNPGVLSYVNPGNILGLNSDALIAIDTATGISPRLDHCELASYDIGAAPGIIYCTIGTAFSLDRCNINNNSGAAVMPISLPGITGRVDIKNSTFTGVYLDISDSVATGSQICNNLFFGNSSTAFPSARGLITLRTTGASTIGHLQIIGNYIGGSPGHGIMLDGSGGGLLEGNLLHDNQIRDYGQTGATAFDGIHLAGDVDYSDIQNNLCRSLAAGARHGINIVAAAAQDNFVTNNNLFQSGGGTSLNDAGTTTVTTAGNRL